MKNLISLICAFVFLSSNSVFAQEIDRASVKEFMDQFISLEHSFDSSIADLYSDDAKIRVYRKSLHGLEPELDINGAEFKKLIKKVMPIAKQRGDKNDYRNLTMKHSGKYARIKADRHSSLWCYTDSEFYLVIKRQESGEFKIIEEYMETRPGSHCVSYSSEGLAEAKTVFDLSKCLLKKTTTMCAYEELLKTVPSRPIGGNLTIANRIDTFFLTMPNKNWKEMWPDKDTKTGLELIHESGHAYVLVNWHEGEQDTYEKRAKNALQPLAEKLNTEPEEVPLEIWPYNEGGKFYSICYETNMNTKECMFSAAANLPKGVVSIFTTSEMNESLEMDVANIIMSLDSH